MLKPFIAPPLIAYRPDENPCVMSCGRDVGSLRQLVLRAGGAAAVGARERAALRRPFGARVGREVVVERPVLFDDEDHVLDRAVAVRRRRCRCRRSRRRPRSSVAAARPPVGAPCVDAVAAGDATTRTHTTPTTTTSASRGRRRRRRRDLLRVGRRRCEDAAADEPVRAVVAHRAVYRWPGESGAEPSAASVPSAAGARPSSAGPRGRFRS